MHAYTLCIAYCACTRIHSQSNELTCSLVAMNACRSIPAVVSGPCRDQTNLISKLWLSNLRLRHDKNSSGTKTELDKGHGLTQSYSFFSGKQLCPAAEARAHGISTQESLLNLNSFQETHTNTGMHARTHVHVQIHTHRHGITFFRRKYFAKDMGPLTMAALRLY